MNKSISHNAWENYYSSRCGNNNIVDDYRRYKNNYLEDTIRQIKKYWKPQKGEVFLEIGCGSSFLGLELAKRYKVKIIGVDFSETAIKSAKELFKVNNVKSAKFIRADISKMPLGSNSVDFIYGGGVIEHSKNTHEIVGELYRVLKKNRYTFNTVPALNLGSLTYRQLWGNVPNLPVLRNVFELIHLNILGGKHMRFGYELSFLPGTLYKIHKKAGFRNITVDKFEIKLILEYIPTRTLKNLASFVIEKVPGFWPMIYVAAKK